MRSHVWILPDTRSNSLNVLDMKHPCTRDRSKKTPAIAAEITLQQLRALCVSWPDAVLSRILFALEGDAQPFHLSKSPILNGNLDADGAALARKGSLRCHLFQDLLGVEQCDRDCCSRWGRLSWPSTPYSDRRRAQH